MTAAGSFGAIHTKAPPRDLPARRQTRRPRARQRRRTGLVSSTTSSCGGERHLRQAALARH
eukprot:5664001-Prymnesium_polylepis.1